MTLDVRVQADLPIAVDMAFQVKPGEVLALVGPSGAGKTTILRAIAGLWRPAQARISVAGQVWHDSALPLFRPSHQRAVGVVFQSYALFPHLTATQNLTIAMPAQPAAAKRAAALRLLQAFGLDMVADHRPDRLSGGQMQRVAIARALARNPQVLLLDEPFSAVDLPSRAALYTEITALRQVLDIPVVLVTHDMAEAERLADRIMVIAAGKCIAEGTAFDVFSDPRAIHTLGLREAGTVIEGRIHSHAADGLTQVTTSAGPVWVPLVDLARDATIRLRIAAHDVMIATTAPTGISALNVLPATVVGLRDGDGPGVMVQLQLGDAVILARITRRSATALGLQIGSPCFAVLKSLSIGRHQIG